MKIYFSLQRLHARTLQLNSSYIYIWLNNVNNYVRYFMSFIYNNLASIAIRRTPNSSLTPDRRRKRILIKEKL